MNLEVSYSIFRQKNQIRQKNLTRSNNSQNLEAVLNLFRDRLRPMLKQIGVRDMQSIAGYRQKSRGSRCETGAQYGRNIPA